MLSIAFDAWLQPSWQATLPSIAKPLMPAGDLFSSGTAGKPKCIVHMPAGCCCSTRRSRCSTATKENDRLFYHTTCGWMMWNWLVSAFASKAT